MDPNTDVAARRAQLEAELAALDAEGTTDPSVAPGPLATPTSPPPATDTATAPPAQPGDATAAARPAGYVGPKVGETVSHTFTDPYDNDAEVTRYGVVVGTHPADPDVSGSTDRAEIVWLPAGSALLDVADLDSL
jgi:hypothetical protein